MRELRLNRELYDAPSIDTALQVFARFAQFERKEEPAHWLIRITAKSEARERHIYWELANYTLGLTVKGQMAS